jgi:proline iminopeptidase
VISSIVRVENGEMAIYMPPPRGLPQLYCVHGGMGLSSDSLFDGLAPLTTLYDLVFIDQRGCGKSGAAKNGSYLLSDFADDIYEVVKQTRTAGDIGILGHSMGGMIAIETLSKYPDLFQFSILSNAALDDSWRSDAGAAVKRFDSKSMKSATSRYSESPNDGRLRELAMVYGPLYFRELPDEKARLEMLKFSYRGDAIAFMNEKVFPGMNLSVKASAIRALTLVIGGAMDIIVPARCQTEIVEVIPNSSLALIEGAGHFPFVTNRERFYQQVSQWWEETRRKSK